MIFNGLPQVYRRARDTALMEDPNVAVLRLAQQILEFVKDPEIGHFGGLGGPGSPGNHSKRCGAKPRTFWKGFPGRRGRPDPQNDRLPGP